MHDCERHRNLAVRVQLMMIGDDERETEVVCDARFTDRTHSAINRDDEFDAFVAKESKRFGVEPVTLFDTMRHIDARIDLWINCAKHVPHDGTRHDAVDVVVAVDRNAFAAAHCIANCMRSLLRVVQVGRML